MVFTSEGTVRNRKTDNSTANGVVNDSETSNMSKDNVDNPSEGSKNSTGQNGGEEMKSEEGSPPSVKYNSAGEYAQAVQQWIQQYHMWNNMQYTMCMMPWYAMTMAAQQSLHQQSNGLGTSSPTLQPRPAPVPQQQPPAGGAAAQPQAPPPQARATPRPAERPRPRHPGITQNGFSI